MRIEEGIVNLMRPRVGGRQVHIKGEMQIFALRQIAKTGEAESASAPVLGERSDGGFFSNRVDFDQVFCSESWETVLIPP